MGTESSGAVPGKDAESRSVRSDFMEVIWVKSVLEKEIVAGGATSPFRGTWGRG